MNEANQITFKGANAMPASTYRFLRVNDIDIQIPANLTAAPLVKARLSGDARCAGDCENALEQAVSRMRDAWEQAFPAPTPEERAEREAVLAAEADATYGGTAQSVYQMGADEREELRSLAIWPYGGMGADVDAFLADVAPRRIDVLSDPFGTVDAQVVVSAKAQAISAAFIDVVAAEGSTVKLSIVVDSPGEFGVADDMVEIEAVDPTAAHVASGAIGAAGTFVRVFADDDATVDIVRTQTLDDEYMDLDDMGLLLGERSRVTVRQTIIGAGEAYAGLAGDLRGDSGCVEVDTRYLGSGCQVRDLNYSLRHHGTRTRCDLDANGVLSGESQKTLRGTIDLIRGCKGSEGSENETVLLVDEGVRNKTVPVILCNEDDVAGNHGATIGHVRDEQLFYLASRGLSQKAAETMFANALLEQAAIDAPDEAARAAVLRIGERLAPGFAALFDEGV